MQPRHVHFLAAQICILLNSSAILSIVTSTQLPYVKACELLYN